MGQIHGDSVERNAHPRMYKFLSLFIKFLPNSPQAPSAKQTDSAGRMASNDKAPSDKTAPASNQSPSPTFTPAPFLQQVGGCHSTEADLQDHPPSCGAPPQQMAIFRLICRTKLEGKGGGLQPGVVKNSNSINKTQQKTTPRFIISRLGKPPHWSYNWINPTLSGLLLLAYEMGETIFTPLPAVFRIKGDRNENRLIAPSHHKNKETSISATIIFPERRIGFPGRCPSLQQKPRPPGG